MNKLITEWKRFIDEETQTNPKFEKNVDIIRQAYKNSFYGSGPATIALIETFTPDNAKILTQIELEDADKVMSGAYSKVFPIKGSDMLLKLFTQGEKVENDIARMKKIADQIFKGEASLGQMHYFEFGTLGETPENVNEAGTERMTIPEPGYQKPVAPKLYFKYVIMPKITTFPQSVFYNISPTKEKSGALNQTKLADNRVFNMLSKAVQETARKSHPDISYTDFFDDVIERISKSFRESLFYTPNDEKKEEIDKLAARFDAAEEIISKIIRTAYRTFKQEGGTDLHLGNLGFFPQKPDDWFYFDM